MEGKRLHLPTEPRLTRDWLRIYPTLQPFMKIRRLIALFGLLGSLMSFSKSATAEESKSAVQTLLSHTTISGYVDTSAIWRLGGQTTAAQKCLRSEQDTSEIHALAYM